MRWTEEDLNAARQRMAGINARPNRVRPKYGNTRITYQGLVFDSKHELEQWKAFQLQQAAGIIRAVIRQVSIPLPGTTRRHRIDFLVIENDGRYRWWDAKGMDTPMAKLKRHQVLEAYGIEVQLC